MKINKFYESLQDDLIDKLQEIIKKDNKTINGFKFGYDSMSGVFEWTNDNYMFYATPYYENYKKIPINIMSDDGDEIDQYNIKLPTMKTEDQIIEVVKFYYKKIDKITGLLNKRTELENMINILCNAIDGDEFIEKLNEIEIYFISDKKVDTLLKTINYRYPHILQAGKYNL